MLPIVFSSFEAGAPVLNNAAGALIGVLDACLVTGFNVKNIASLSVSDGVATVTTQTAHGYLAAGMNTAGGSTTATGNRVTLSGFAESALNADFAVQSVPNSTTFTVNVALADGSYGGTGLQAKRTPLGWAKAHSGANKAIYAMTVLQAFGQMLRVNDSAGGIDARVLGVESATDVDTYTNPFPTESQLAGGGYWAKGTNSATAKQWVLVGDERGFFWLPSGTYLNVHWFGDITSFKVGETFGAMLAYSYSGTNIAFVNSLLFGTDVGRCLKGAYQTNSLRLARQHNGIATSVLAMSVKFGGSVITGDASFPNYPSPVDNGVVIMEPVLIQEELSGASGNSSNNPLRGIMPGMVEVLCRNDQMSAPPCGLPLDSSGIRILVFAGVVGGPSSALGVFAVKLSSWR